MLTVACVNVGDKYAPTYVHTLHSMVSRHLSIPHQFVCITDHPERYENAPFTLIKDQTGLHGWWAKLGLHNKAHGLTGRVLYLDLDVVIVNSIDKLIKPKGYWIIDDWLEECYNSSVMLYTAEEHYDLYDQYDWRDSGVYKTDQHYVYYKYGKCKLFNAKEVVSYKQDHCEESIPNKAKIVVFHGFPKPPDCGGWVKDYWR